MFNAALIGVNLKKLNVGVIVLIIQAFMWISADFVYGQYAAMVREVLLIYFILFLIVRVTLGGKVSTVRPGASWASFIIAFILTSVAVMAFGLIGGAAEVASLTSHIPQAAVGVSALGFGALHAFVKAYIEEDVFRAALPRMAGFGDIISSVIFGAFHLSILIMQGMILQLALIPMAVLVVLGMVWSQVRNHFGIMGAVGSHFAWNLFAIGVLFGIFTGGLV